MRIIYILLMFLVATNLYAAKEVKIDEECVYLDELTADYIVHKAVTCGFKAGESRYYSKEVITSYLKEEGIKATVLNDVKVTRTGENVSYEQIYNAVIDSFKATYPDIRVEVTNVNIPRDIISASTGDFKVTVDTSKFGSTFVEIENNNKKVSSYVHVRAFKKGYVASDKIAKDEDISGKVLLDDIDITTLRGRLITNASELIAVRTIPKGRVISSELVSQKPSARKGEQVKLILSSGYIVLETTGVLQEHAFVGKGILVKSKDTDKIISAVYIGNGVAKASY